MAQINVDPDRFDAAGQNGIQIFKVMQNKARTPERMLHPGAAKLLDVHSKHQLINVDAFKHGASASVNADAWVCDHRDLCRLGHLFHLFHLFHAVDDPVAAN